MKYLRIANKLHFFSTFVPEKYTGISFAKTKQYHNDYMMPFYKPYYKEPFFAVQGNRQYLYDDKGDQYLDLVGGISCANVGHCHPRLNKIFKDQANKVLHMTAIYFNQYQGQYAKALCEQLGDGFDMVYFCNSGSQANDFAHLLARLYTGSEKIFSLRQAYHGISGNAYSLSNIRTWNSSMPKFSQTQKLAWPNLYRKPYLTVDNLIDDAEEQMSSASNGKIAGFWVQPLMGASGIIQLPEGYLPKMYNLVKKYDGLFICDEVHTGFGRIGKQFWGHRWKGIKPDIVITAKAMANGYPLGAVIASKQIMSAFNHNFFNTYGGGVLQCRLGIQVLKIIKQQKLAQNAEIIGSYLKAQFRKIQEKSRIIGDVRGKGIMLGIQFVEDKQTKKRAPQIAAKVIEDFKRQRILFAKCGQEGNVIRITGPLCLTMDNAKKIVQVMQDSVKKYE